MRPYQFRSFKPEIFGIIRLTIMKLLNQLEHVDNATPLARRLDGNTSLGIAHGYGVWKLAQALVGYCIESAARIRATIAIRAFKAMISGVWLPR